MGGVVLGGAPAASSSPRSCVRRILELASASGNGKGETTGKRTDWYGFTRGEKFGGVKMGEGEDFVFVLSFKVERFVFLFAWKTKQI